MPSWWLCEVVLIFLGTDKNVGWRMGDRLCLKPPPLMREGFSAYNIYDVHSLVHITLLMFLCPFFCVEKSVGGFAVDPDLKSKGKQ